MTIRWKLVAILVVPLAALIGLAGIGIRDRRDTAGRAGQERASAALASAVSAVADGVENEMVVSAQTLRSSDKTITDALAADRLATDKAIVAFRRLAPAGSDTTDLGGSINRANRSLDGLRITRGAVDGKGDQGTNALTVYQFALTRLQDVNNQIALAQRGAEATEFAAYAALGRAKQSHAEELSLLTLWAMGSDLSDQQKVQVGKSRSTADTQTEVFLSLASPADKQQFRSVIAGQAADDLAVIQQAYAQQGAPAGVTRARSAAGLIADLRTVESSVEGQIAARAATAVSDAEGQTRAFMLLAAAALAFALLSASMLARSISRPVSRLIKAARRVSNEHLPRLLDTVRGTAEEGTTIVVEPIDIGTRDELGELAEAFNAIQETAVSVAGEQADMIRRGIGELFVNLARRNQSLLDRQIGFLDELEAHESDPEVLADLFKLDHLATRMRRNAESLLVLAGTETPRRWGKPVPLSDVVRAAIGEVEDYARIRIVGLDERPVHGAAAADLAHLLAEVLDNASQYSPPDTTVEVHGTAVPGGYRLAVRDYGIGMTEEQRLEHNATLAEPPRTGLHLSRSLGYAVVGRLATRHGVTVELQRADGPGLLATISLPA
jgi:HAMP domain-containing protein